MGVDASDNRGYSMKRLLGLALIGLLAGCVAPTQVVQIDNLSSVGEQPKILLMPPDVKYYVLTAGGVPEPQADWTAAARVNFLQALSDFAAKRNTDVIMPDETADDDPDIISYEKLHSAVGSTILVNHFGLAPLPSKAGMFDWSLGPGVNAIAKNYGADYALFSFYRDYQASGGRIAFAILAAAAGASVSTTAEFGFASLVDLNTGEIVWFNKVDVGAGELRDEDGAMKVIETLFAGLPEG